MNSRRGDNLSLFHLCKICSSNCCQWGGPIISEIEIDRILNAGYQNAFIQESGYFRIMSWPQGGCFYFDDGKCVIQDVKPIGCKTFPITKFYDKYSGFVIIGICVRCHFYKSIEPQFIEKARFLANQISDSMAIVWTDMNKYPVVDLDMLKIQK